MPTRLGSPWTDLTSGELVAIAPRPEPCDAHQPASRVNAPLGRIVGDGAMGGPRAETGADHREHEASTGKMPRQKTKASTRFMPTGATTSPSTSSLPSIA